jgi:hypothetical protein
MEAEKLLAEIGRLTMENKALRDDRATILKIFSEVLTGECEITRIMIDLTNQKLVWAPPGLQPALPSTINGIPQCVVAPIKLDDPPQSSHEGNGVFPRRGALNAE